MALQKNVNSYVTVAEADLYFADRLDGSNWTSLDNSIKEKLLIMATMLIDTYEFAGSVISDNQSLAFPRYGIYYDPKLGHNVELTNTVPDRILKTTYELAFYLNEQPEYLSPVMTVDEIQVDVIKLKGLNNPIKLPSVVNKMIQPLRLNSSYMWWRSN